MASSDTVSLLRDVDVFIFDALGTTVDWFTTVTRQVARLTDTARYHHDRDRDAAEFAHEWRQGYLAHIRAVNEGSQGSLNLDVVHRKILDEMLASARWSHLATLWDAPARSALVQVWHDLDAYEDVLPGLSKLREYATVVTLSNANFRLLVDMSKNRSLPWDGILSTEFFGVYKPSKEAYVAASYHLGVPPDRIAMVAAHKWDLEGATRAGLKTIYVPRPAEDAPEVKAHVRSGAEGGDVDVVIRDFIELAALVAEAKK